MLSNLAETTQTISFSEADGVTSSDIYANNVIITTNAGCHQHGSSMMKMKSLVDYNWEPKYYSGQLLALHVTGKYLAYSMKGYSMNSSMRGMVRVVHNIESGDVRVLIKGLKGEVQDLAFAHIENQVILASIDEDGRFYIHEIKCVDNALRYLLLAEVHNDPQIEEGYHRVVWCPYIPEEDEEADDDVSRLLLTTHANTGRVWNTRMIEQLSSNNADRSISARFALESSAGHTPAEHAAHIVDGTFAPDGTALATAAMDGYVMFFQVSSDNTAPRCLHKWQPHGSSPLSSIFFLDNHNDYTTEDQFWKFAVTGAENNSILKIWSCKTWVCLQTITFAPNLQADSSLIGVKAQVDFSASYLLVSELRSRCLYVLRVCPDASVTAIAEYAVPCPVLSFVPLHEQPVPKCESRCDDPLHQNGSSSIGMSPVDYDLHRDDSPADGGCNAVRLRLYVVQPKGLQEAILTYTPPLTQSDIINDNIVEDTETNISSSILQQQTQQLKMLLMKSQVQQGGMLSQRPESPPALNLMTPDAFSSPGKREEDELSIVDNPDVNANSTVYEECLPNMEQQFTSACSSPSREVQEIMFLTEPDLYADAADGEPNPAKPVTDEQVGEYGQPEFKSSEHLDTISLVQAGSLVQAVKEKNWPQISIAQINEANNRKSSSDKSSSQSINTSNVEPATEAPPEIKHVPALSDDDRRKLEILEQKLDKLTELLSQQGQEIRSLRGELNDPRQVIEQALVAHTERTTAAIDKALSDGWDRISMCGRAAATAAGRGAAQALEPLAASLQAQLAARICNADTALRDALPRLLAAQPVLDKLSSSLSASLSESVRLWFRDALQTSVLPAMEKSHQVLFKQFNNTFQQGAKDFAANTEALARAAADRGGASAAAALRIALEKHTSALSAAAAAPNQQQLVSTLTDVTNTVVQKELSRWRQEVVAMSRAHSPVMPAPPVKDRQMQLSQIQAHIRANDVNSAFQLALSASDLTLVVAACQLADPARVFGPPCALPQHVLLSLMQQLAADMSHDTETKHRYLEEAVLAVDSSNPVTREHLPVVLRDLKKHVTAFLATNPGHVVARQMKMINMATDSLLNSL